MTRSEYKSIAAVELAHIWLKGQREQWDGPMNTWTDDAKDRYHRDLGLLVDFVTDCWPNDEETNDHNRS